MNTSDFLDAVKRGDVSIVEQGLSTHPALRTAHDTHGVSAILLSVFHGQAAVTKVLLAPGPELDLFEAATVGNLERVRHLLEVDRTQLHGFSSSGFTPLGLAAFFGHREVVAELLDRGAAIDEPDRSFNGNTALDAAVAANHTETALLLMEHGATVNVRDKSQFTPLHKAAHRGNRVLVDELLSRGADKHAQNKDGKRPVDFLPAGSDMQPLLT